MLWVHPWHEPAPSDDATTTSTDVIAPSTDVITPSTDVIAPSTDATSSDINGNGTAESGMGGNDDVPPLVLLTPLKQATADHNGMCHGE